MNTNHGHRRRGSIYVAVLGGAVALSVIGITTLTALRVQRQSAEAAVRFANARLYARSAIEMGFGRIDTDPDWRANNASGVWVADAAIGSGSYTLEAVDPVDGILGNDITDPLVLRGTGVDGSSRFEVEVRLQPELRPLDALGTCLHAAGQLLISAGKTPTFIVAPLSTNANLENDGTIYGDVDADSVEKLGTVTGTLTVPAPPKDMPDPGVFDLYMNMATAIAFPTNIDKQVLSPSVNPWGAANGDGLYFIDTGGQNMAISDSRIVGTLVVRCGASSTVKVEKTVLMQNFRSDYPVLIVDGNLIVDLPSASQSLSESALSINFNPPGAAYLGVTDSDTLDTYPNEIRGLVHVTGTISMLQTSRVRGAVISEANADWLEYIEIIHNPKLYYEPPYGYTKPPIMKVVPGSWRRVVE